MAFVYLPNIVMKAAEMEKTHREPQRLVWLYYHLLAFWGKR